MKAHRPRLELHGVLCALAFLSVPGPAAAALAVGPPALDGAVSHDGLQKIEIKGIDLAYALPGAPLAGCTQLRLDPVKVSFHKDWNPTRQGSRLKLSDADRERIRSDVADTQSAGLSRSYGASAGEMTRVADRFTNSVEASDATAAWAPVPSPPGPAT